VQFVATYRVSGTPGRVVLHFRIGPRLMQGIPVVLSAAYPWELSFESREGDSLFLSAESEDGAGSVNCEILLDGTPVSASKPGASAVSCSAVASRE